MVEGRGAALGQEGVQGGGGGLLEAHDRSDLMRRRSLCFAIACGSDS